MNEPQRINVIDVICRSYRHLDSRLISHGERVSYILMKMLEDTRRYTPQEKYDIFILGLLHDIGAYKDNEIDSMLNFDTGESMEHSVFGYLLFKALSPLPQYADVILYHHHCNAQYYSVPIDTYHRDIAKLIYLADRIDIFRVQQPEEELGEFLSQHSGSAFYPSDVRWFWSAEDNYHILENLQSLAYRDEINEYIQNTPRLTAEQNHKYLRTLVYSIDFRSDYTALHTDYAVELSKNISQMMQLPSQLCDTIAMAALFHNAGKVSYHGPVTSSGEYADYLEALYSNAILDVTREILTGNVDAQILAIIEESYSLLHCLDKGQPLSGTPGQPAEIVALSYLMSNALSLEMNVSYFHHPRLLAFLREKYQACGMDDTILKALEQSFDHVIGKTQHSCAVTYDIYHQMMGEYRSLNMVLKHYNRKY